MATDNGQPQVGIETIATEIIKPDPVVAAARALSDALTAAGVENDLDPAQLTESIREGRARKLSCHRRFGSKRRKTVRHTGCILTLKYGCRIGWKKRAGLIGSLRRV